MWRRIARPALGIGSAIAFWASLLTMNTVNLHSVVSLVSPTLTTILVFTVLAREISVLYQRSRLKKWQIHERARREFEGSKQFIAVGASVFASFLLVGTLLFMIWTDIRL